MDQGLDKADWQTRRQIIRALVKEVKVSDEQVCIVYRVNTDPFVEAPKGGFAQDCPRRPDTFSLPKCWFLEQSGRLLLRSEADRVVSPGTGGRGTSVSRLLRSLLSDRLRSRTPPPSLIAHGQQKLTAHTTQPFPIANCLLPAYFVNSTNHTLGLSHDTVPTTTSEPAFLEEHASFDAAS